MAFLLTGVQHKADGDTIMSVHKYETTDAWKEKYHREMDYAISNVNFIGLGIIVLDYATLETVFTDVWVRGEEEPEPDETGD